MKRLCTICARGGSKGVKNKNSRLLHGKPLIAHSILQAKKSRLFAAVAVSSDSKEILSIAKKWGADYLIWRPKPMASDRAAKLPAIQHCALETEKLSGLRFHTSVDLDATSPLRNIGDIHGAVRLLESRGAFNVITGMPARHSPYFNLVETDRRGIARLSKPPKKKVVRRQDAPACYDLNASIYVWRWDALVNSRHVLTDETLLYVMPPERSLDIDSELDFKIVEYLSGRKR